MTSAWRSARRALVGAAVAAPLALAGYAHAESVMRVVPQADLKNLDPIWTTAAITQNHGYMIYDTLFALNAKLEPKPQMVDTWTKSADGLAWSFTLRKGMKWHDGTPVTAKDAVASLSRWGKRATDGAAMMGRVETATAKDDLTFELKMKEPFGPVLDVLANPALPAFIMREKDALTDPFQQVPEAIGSGPFVFAKDEWVPGSKVVYRKFKDYVPRAEPSDGFAGGKVAKLDKVEWIYIPDTNTAVQALLKGEVDAIEQPPYDLLPLMKKDRNIVVKVLDPVGKMGHIRPNFLYPPFDDVRARQALWLLIDQKEFLAAMVGTPEFEKECYAVFMCGSPLAMDSHSEPYRKANLAKAKQLLAESGYKGEPIVIMQPTDQQLIGTIALVIAQKLRDIGANVKLEALDWSTLTSRRTRQDKPGPGSPGWHIFTTWWTGVPMSSPITNAPLVTTCDKKNWFGWPCDDQIEKLRADFIKAGTLAEQRQVVDALQKRFFEFLPYVNTGQFFAPVAWRTTLQGVPDALLFVAWNIEKK
ncbi:MAG: ABC transporter substrate-binding protein [Alphaproteobacteria bacterium]|nr:ABC transporter substrate-binding protein [Alphaproteobacteria bacterium]